MSTEYRKMWQELGLDLENHDKLLQALPEIYASIYLSQEGRPTGMRYYDYVISEIHGLRIKELLEHKKRGGKVFGTFCIYVPDEIIIAAGGIAVGLCAGADFSVPVGEKLLPRNLCALIKSFFGFKLGALCPYAEAADLLIGETTCDGKKKAWELLSEITPTYVMDLPNCKKDQDKKLWLGELYNLMEKVEQVSGKKITAEALSKATDLMNRKRAVLRRLFELRKANPSPISGLDALLVVQISFYDDPNRFIEKTTELCDELEDRVRRGVGVSAPCAKRILYSGTPMPIPFWTIYSIIEKSGAVVVAEESCTGLRLIAGNEVPLYPDSLEKQLSAIAERQMQTHCACFTPNKERIDDVVSLYHEYMANGVIHFSLSFCQPYIMESISIKKVLQEKYIPVVTLDGDYSEQQAAQLKTRIEAFLEMI